MMNKSDISTQESPQDEASESRAATLAARGDRTTPTCLDSSASIKAKHQEHGTSSQTSQAASAAATTTDDADNKIIKKPDPADILCGRGKPFQNHSGNLEMRKLVDEYKDRYQAAPRNRKTLITEEILARISESGGRFLKQHGSDQWVPVTRAVAFEKVSHAFRSRIGGNNSSSRTSKAADAKKRREQQTSSLPGTVAGTGAASQHSALFGVRGLTSSTQQHQQRLTSSLSALSASMFPSRGASSATDGANASSNTRPAFLPHTRATAHQHQTASPGNGLGAFSAASLGGLFGEFPSLSANGAAQMRLGAAAGGGTGASNLLSTSQRAYYETLLGAQQQSAAAATMSQQQSLSSALGVGTASGLSRQGAANNPRTMVVAAAAAAAAGGQQQQGTNVTLSSAAYENLLQQNQTLESLLYNQQLNDLLSNLGIPPSSFRRHQQPPPR